MKSGDVMKKLLVLIAGLFMLLTMGTQVFAQTPTLDPANVSKFENALPVIRDLNLRVDLTAGENFNVSMEETEQDLLGPVNVNGVPTTYMTRVWGYNFPQTGLGPTYPGATIVAKRDVQVQIEWQNNLPGNFLPVDASLHMAHPNNINTAAEVRAWYEAGNVPTVTHLHGGHTESASDGLPEAWFTQGFSETGATFVKPRYRYDNTQEAATLWYHDHALGITRLNVYAGLAGFYFLRDDNELGLISSGVLPADPYEVEIVIQDRMFDPDGQLFYPAYKGDPAYADFIDGEGAILPPEIFPDNGGPTALAEFFGDIILVNGKAWPKLDVEPRKYRFRFLNGSDSRFYILKFANGGSYENFYVIGTDDGLLPSPVTKTELVFAPGERYDVIVDFTGLENSQIVLENWGPDEPFGGGEPGVDFDPADPQTTGKIMRFDVLPTSNNTYAEASVTTGTSLRPAITPLVPTGETRNLVLFEGTDEFGRLQPLLGTLDEGSLAWFAPITENPMLDDVEVWEVYNATGDAHPIHLHLVSFQIIDRRPFDGEVEEKDQPQHNGTYGVGGKLEASSITFTGPAVGPEDHEKGWKDTAVMYPGEVTRVIAKFDRVGRYVWHCHILSHEDHEMMRPFEVFEGTPNDDFVLFAETEIKFYKTTSVHGDLHSNGNIDFDKGGPGEYHGNATAVEDIKIDKYNTIHGDVTAGEEVDLDKRATVTGTVTENATVDYVNPLPFPSFTIGSNDFEVSKNKTKTLAPGNYKTVTVNKEATLKISAGTYNMERLDIEKSASLIMDTQLGPVTINIADRFETDKYAVMTILNGTTKDVTFNIGGSETMPIRGYSTWMGNINAPNAKVKLEKYVYFKGAICADEIDVEKYVEVDHHGFSFPHLPKWLAGDEESDMELDSNVPTAYALDQNYPNPFNPTTSIQFALPQSDNVKLKIYNIRGQLVRNLANANYEAGYHTLQWDATDDRGVKVASGIYIYRLQAGKYVQNKKMLLVK